MYACCETFDVCQAVSCNLVQGLGVKAGIELWVFFEHFLNHYKLVDRNILSVSSLVRFLPLKSNDNIFPTGTVLLHSAPDRCLEVFDTRVCLF